jgi:hypothetical protein
MSITITVLRTDWHWASPKKNPSKTTGAAPSGRVITSMLTGSSSPDDRNSNRQNESAGSTKRR